MNEPPEDDDDVIIVPPDKSLLQKIGVANLDEVFSSGLINSAQNAITDSAGEFLEEALTDAKTLETLFQDVLQSYTAPPTDLAPMIDCAFAIKTKTGLAGYDLVSTLAKSLQFYCEARTDVVLTQKNIDIIQWHVSTIQQILKLKIQGGGGAMGDAIRAELIKLVPAKAL